MMRRIVTSKKVELHQGGVVKSRARRLLGVAAPVAVIGLATIVLASTTAETQDRNPAGTPPEVVVHVADLPKSALYELESWNDAASPGGKMLGVTNNGDELDPPPENDPHATFKVQIQSGVPYRCWVHMKVGTPKGASQANTLFVQFTDAVDKANKDVLKPGTNDSLAVRGPAREGWTWVGSERMIYFRTSGEVTVRVQAGAEGVGFDQLVLSPARFLAKPPAQAIVAKSK
jgi:hypothetical protein